MHIDANKRLLEEIAYPQAADAYRIVDQWQQVVDRNSVLNHTLIVMAMLTNVPPDTQIWDLISHICDYIPNIESFINEY